MGYRLANPPRLGLRVAPKSCSWDRVSSYHFSFLCKEWEEGRVFVWTRCLRHSPNLHSSLTHRAEESLQELKDPLNSQQHTLSSRPAARQSPNYNPPLATLHHKSPTPTNRNPYPTDNPLLLTALRHTQGGD